MSVILQYVGLAGFLLSIVHWTYELFRARPRVHVMDADVYSYALRKDALAMNMTLVLTVLSTSSTPAHISAAALSTVWHGKRGYWFAVPLNEHGKFPAEAFQADQRVPELQSLLAPYAQLPCTVPPHGSSRIACVFLCRSEPQILKEWVALYESSKALSAARDPYETYFEVRPKRSPLPPAPSKLRIRGCLWLGRRRVRFDLAARMRKDSNLGTAFD